MSAPTAVFESFHPSLSGWSQRFGRPRSVEEAFTWPRVLTLLERLENEMGRGRWGVLLLSYESASAFDASLRTHRPGPFPLAWAAVFNRPWAPRLTSPTETVEAPLWRPALRQQDHARAFRQIQHWIGRGHTYQVNFTFPLHARWRGASWPWYRRLAAVQGAPYSAYLDLGRWKVLSFSPELFFERKDALLTVRPMKGSAPRGRWPSEDRALARELRESSKERAENVMIVDLLRSDVGKIARPGTVRTTRLFQTEAYPTLWQMTSKIRATLRPEIGLTPLLRALFPSGSVTGAPKGRTMDILRRVEPTPRGLYTGALALLRPNGHWTASVGIRTLVVDEKTGRAVFHVGSGVTAASRADREYRECLLKSDFLNAPLFDLVETLRLEGGRWLALEEHLHRLRDSARRFGFPWREAPIRSLCQRLAARPGLWKVRLLLSRAGTLRPECERLPAVVTPWRVALAQTPIDERNVFFYHKTTHREIYDRFLSARPEVEDVILFNRRGELTESTRANLVVEMDGKRYTPPVPCGLLAGVMRRVELRRGRLRERVLRRADLRRAERVFLLNSVRGWIPTRWR